jgi:cell wall-associated NlpC family hydrolase
MSEKAAFDRRLTPARPDLAATRLRGEIEAARYVDGEKMRVVAEAIAVRAEPNPEAGYDTQALFGEQVTAYDLDDEGWAWVQLESDGYVGYISANDLAPPGAAPTQTVRAPRTFVYPAPSMKTAPILALPMLSQVAVLDHAGAFARIDGGGFVWADHLRPIQDAEDDFVSVAERFEHAPYLWGGKTWAGLDCSGLVQIALRAAGVPAPRDTDMQARALGREIDPGVNFSGLQRGDLVFWKGHIGVMCDERALLHANGSHMQVTREPLAQARARITHAGHGDITCVRRF